MSLNPLAGRLAPKEILIDVDQLIGAFTDFKIDPRNPAQRVAFGTSGHRGTSLNGSFNRLHIQAMAQAVCEYRALHGIKGPLFLGIDTHALSKPAFETALEVIAANDVDVMIQKNATGPEAFTPTPAISLAILTHNRRAKNSRNLADGIVITPSHNPPQDGGFKYNPPSGGPAGTEITAWIEKRAGVLMLEPMAIRRTPFHEAVNAPNVHHYDFVTAYVSELDTVLDLKKISDAKIRIGVDPMGGAGLGYWEPIAEKYGLDVTVVNKSVDPRFAFMTVDKDGKIRMDCSSPYAMAGLIDLKDKFDVAFGNDADADRHGIVTPTSGLMNPNHYLAVAIEYLFTHRPGWSKKAAVGKTLVSSAMIDRVAKKLGRELREVPVGFKWFVDGLLASELGFGGEESAGASFLRRDGSVWTTDKDGILLNLLAAEITAVTGSDPGRHYLAMTKELGAPVYERLDAPADEKARSLLKKIDPRNITATELAGEPILAKLTKAPSNNADIGGLKVVTENAWFAARPSGTEDVYKIYVESFKGKDHLERVKQEAKAIVDRVIQAEPA